MWAPGSRIFAFPGSDHIFLWLSLPLSPQLCGRFNLSDGELTTVLEALSYVFEQAAYHTIRPASLPPLSSTTGCHTLFLSEKLIFRTDMSGVPWQLAALPVRSAAGAASPSAAESVRRPRPSCAPPLRGPCSSFSLFIGKDRSDAADARSPGMPARGRTIIKMFRSKSASI